MQLIPHMRLPLEYLLFRFLQIQNLKKKKKKESNCRLYQWKNIFQVKF